MVQAFLFSEARGLCAKGTGARVAAHLKSAGLPTRLADVPGDLPSPAALVDIMCQDKKAVAGELTFILAKGIGEAFIARKVPGADVVEFLDRRRQTLMTYDIVLSSCHHPGAADRLSLFLRRRNGAHCHFARKTDRTGTTRQLARLAGARAHPQSRTADRRSAGRQQHRQHFGLGCLRPPCSFRMFGDIGAVIASVIMTVLVIIFSEVMPKTYAIAYPDRMALCGCPHVMRCSSPCFGPIVIAIEFIVKKALSLLGANMKPMSTTCFPPMTKSAAPSTCTTRKAASLPATASMMGGLLDLKDLENLDVMVHRTTDDFDRC